MVDDSYFLSEKSNLRGKINTRFLGYGDDPIIQEVIDKVLTSAARASVNAGYSGSYSDGGARESVSELNQFLAGYHFAKTGQMIDSYQEIVKEYQNSLDPEYKKFMELKQKFEGN